MKALVAVVMIAGAGVAMAQDHHHKQHGPGPYTGMQTRTVKALSPEQIADLKAGRGTGFWTGRWPSGTQRRGCTAARSTP